MEGKNVDPFFKHEERDLTMLNDQGHIVYVENLEL